MNEPIIYFDRKSRAIREEKIFGGFFIHLLYGRGFISRRVGAWLISITAHLAWVSMFFGWWQRRCWTKRKIQPFIRDYGVNEEEFLQPPSSYATFNDFFIRKLKPAARPIATDPMALVAPADGRYHFVETFKSSDRLLVKGQRFTVGELIGDEGTAEEYGSLLIARLCPSDYHRFHFPADCYPGPTHTILGPLYSVNPFALKKIPEIFCKNKRSYSILESSLFGKILFVEVGATCVGTIHQTYSPGKNYEKGDEKGYFSFGGSTLILLFEPNRVKFDEDLIRLSKSEIEIKCQMGEAIAHAVQPT